MNISRYSWETLLLLARLEGDLLVSRALLSLEDFMCDDILLELNKAAFFVTDVYVEGVTQSLYSSEVLVAIDRIAREINEHAWLTELQWSREFHAQIREDYRQAADEAELRALHVDETEYEGRCYVCWPYRGTWTAGLVWEPDVMPESGHYQIRVMQNDHVVATVSDLQDARSIAGYAASHDGGYGDVCICRCAAAITHESFESWFLN